MTYTLVALNVMVYLWDRGGSLFSSTSSFSDYGMRPREILLILQGQGNPADLSTLFTSMFMHGNLWHLLGNVVFLVVFGENIEAALGATKFALYFIFWGLLASATQIWMNPGSSDPTIGASGAIGGVMGCYFLLYPGHRVRFWIFPIIFVPFVASAWILLGVWFVEQIVLPQPGVANWAHAGGFLGGMLTVLILGGRDKLAKRANLEDNPLDEDDFELG